jgi:hypothetical protein
LPANLKPTHYRLALRDAIIQSRIAIMHDLGVRIVSTLLLSGTLLFVAFFLFSVLYPRKAAAASPVSPAPAISSKRQDYGYLAPVARPIEWTVLQIEAHGSLMRRKGPQVCAKYA